MDQEGLAGGHVVSHDVVSGRRKINPNDNIAADGWFDMVDVAGVLGDQEFLSRRRVVTGDMRDIGGKGGHKSPLITPDDEIPVHIWMVL